MDSIRSDEALRVWLINYLSEKMGEHAILKGGMVLRLLNCPRYTHDLDYVLIPYRSKKEIVPLMEKTLGSLEGITLSHHLHSTNARFEIVLKNQFGTFKTLIEATVSDSCDSQPLSTGDFALQHEQLPHVIRVMRFDIALAHKFAAWNERRLMRDLYDIYFIYKNLGELPNIAVLEERLQKINYARGRNKSALPKKMNLMEFLDFLGKEIKNLTEDDLEKELRDTLDTHQLLGLDKKIKISIGEIIEKLREKSHSHERD